MTAEDRIYFKHPFASNSKFSAITPMRPPAPGTFEMGSLCHAAIMEPHRVDLIKETLDDRPMYTYDLTHEKFVLAIDMRNAIWDNEFCKDFIPSCRKEVCMYNPNTPFEYNGRRFAIDTKRKYDLWNDPGNFGGDVKTTSADSLEQFMESINKFDYDRARVFYAKGPLATKDVIIGVSKKNLKVFLVFMNNNHYLWKLGEDKVNKLAYQYFINNKPF